MERPDREARSLQRRLEVVRLPVTALRLHGYLVPSATRAEWAREPETVGINPDGTALAVWRHRGVSTRLLVTSHIGGPDSTTAAVGDGGVVRDR